MTERLRYVRVGPDEIEPGAPLAFAGLFAQLAAGMLRVEPPEVAFFRRETPGDVRLAEVARAKSLHRDVDGFEDEIPDGRSLLGRVAADRPRTVWISAGIDSLVQCADTVAHETYHVAMGHAGSRASVQDLRDHDERQADRFGRAFAVVVGAHGFAATLRRTNEAALIARYRMTDGAPSQATEAA